MKLVDSVLEATVVPSFTRLGPVVRSRTENWTDLESYELAGRTIAITGATSGIGMVAAQQLAELGARLVVVGRNQEKTERVVAGLARPNDASHEAVIADMGDFEAVRQASKKMALFDGLDTLIHNAGALLNERRETESGHEATVASQVLGPFLMTTLLLDTLKARPATRVLTMSSGGMYTAALTVDQLEMGKPEGDEYKGVEQYARAKRAQVTLTEEWARRYADTTVRFHSLHPGWVNTPGVHDAIPGFGKVVGPLLRTPAEGADTLVWLTADAEALASNGKFWHDRQTRSIHRLSKTRRSDTPERRLRLWDWCVAQTS